MLQNFILKRPFLGYGHDPSAEVVPRPRGSAGGVDSALAPPDPGAAAGEVKPAALRDALLSFAGFAAVPLSPAANHTCEIQAFALLVPYHDTYHIIKQNQG